MSDSDAEDRLAYERTPTWRVALGFVLGLGASLAILFLGQPVVVVAVTRALPAGTPPPVGLLGGLGVVVWLLGLPIAVASLFPAGRGFFLVWGKSGRSARAQLALVALTGAAFWLVALGAGWWTR